MDVYERIGKNIKKLRNENNFTQEKLANEINTSASHLRTLEKGKGNPTVRTLEGIAINLKVDIGRLFDMDDSYQEKLETPAMPGEESFH